MNWSRRIRLRVQALFQKRKLDLDMDEEMRLHIDMQTRANMEAGMDAEGARYAALRKFGWSELIKETCREQRGVTWLENVFQDTRYAIRMLIKNPGFTSVARLNELLTAWTADIEFVLDRLERLSASDPSGKFTGRLDMTRVGVFGHSFGGAQAAQLCSQDSRCKAGIDIDGRPLGSVVQAGLRQPFMFLLSDQKTSDAEGRQVMSDIQSIYAHLPANGRFLVKIRGANHFFFSDDGALLKSHIVLGMLHRLGIVGIDGRRQLAVTTYCVHNFFDEYLKSQGVSQLKISSPLYPEVQVLDQ